MNNDQLFRQALQRQNDRAAQMKMPDNMEERVMQRIQATEKVPQRQSSRKLWLATASAIAIAASIALLVIFYNGQEQTPQEPLVAQQMVKPTAAPSLPIVEVSQPKTVEDEQSGIRGQFSDPDENGITEPSTDSQEPTAMEKVEEPRHFTPRPVLDITSPKDEPFFLASTSYMVAPKSHRNGLAEESAESENSSAIPLPTKTASQNRPQIPSIKENFHKLTKKERKQMAVLGAIEMKRWHIDITTMNTMRYGSRTVTPDFFLELRGDTLHSYLPYLGQAYQSPTLSPAIGLNFEEPVRQYQESRPKSKYTQLDIDVRTREDSYHYVIDIYDSGQATIRVRSLHRDPVSFDGTMEINQ